MARKYTYKTYKEKIGKYGIKATQKITDGHAEGGYTYAIEFDGHILNTGSVSCFAFEKGLPKDELKSTLSTYIERYKDNG